MKIAIVDDEFYYLDKLRSMLSGIIQKGDHVEMYSRGEDYLMRSSFYAFDLVFMDIDLGEDNGLELIEKIYQSSATRYVLVSSYMLDAKRAAHVNVIGYLGKPFRETEIREIYQKVLNQLHQDSLIITIREGKEKNALNANEILYIESYYHRLRIITTRGLFTTGSETFKDNYQKLLSYTFIRVHQSYFVNLLHITKMEKRQLIMSNGDVIKVSQGRYEEVCQRYFEYGSGLR